MLDLLVKNFFQVLQNAHYHTRNNDYCVLFEENNRFLFMTSIKQNFTNLPHSEFKVNYKDSNKLIQHIHYVANYFFPISRNINHNINENSGYSIEVISGGITNLLFLATPITSKDSNHNEHKMNDQKTINKLLLIRVYGENTEILIDRCHEQILFYELGELEFGPKLYAIFGNGRIEQFYSNSMPILLHERKHCKSIAYQLAIMHTLHPTCILNMQPMLWNVIHKWFAIASQLKFSDTKKMKYDSLNWPNIKKQIAFLETFLPSSINNNNNSSKNGIIQLANDFMYESVFSHNDLLGGNILHLKDSNEICFIDFEYGFYNFRGFDFANHFCEYPAFDCDWKKHFPSRMEMYDWIHMYVECLLKNVSENEDVCVMGAFKWNAFSDEYRKVFLDACVDIVLGFSCVDHYFWGLWAVIQSYYSPIDFDFMKYANDRLIGGYQFSWKLFPKYFVTNGVNLVMKNHL